MCNPGRCCPSRYSCFLLPEYREQWRAPSNGFGGEGGHWHVGDREIFFLKKDSGVLRTVLDTYAQTTQPVLTGGHIDYKPRESESIFQMIVDILLTRGQGCGDEQLAQAVSQSTAYAYDLAYAVEKLRGLADDEVPIVRKAAREKLEELSHSWPKIREGWPGRDETSSRK